MSRMMQILKEKIEEKIPFSSFRNPIFIISPPRSGSTFLFECMINFDEIFHISYEADLIWWKHFPYERLEDISDYVGLEEVDCNSIYKFKRSLRARSSLNSWRLGKKWTYLQYHMGIKPMQYLDKTISNSFHLDFLNKAFPDARYIFLLRDPRNVISSMMEGWENKFQKPQLQGSIKKIESRKINNWSYPAAPGWREVVTEPLENVCAWSWAKHIEYPMEFFQRNKISYHTVRYEDLVKDTVSEIYKIADVFDLKVNEKVEKYLSAPKLSSTTVSKPSNNKWKKNNKVEIENILPKIKELSNKIGYNI